MPSRASSRSSVGEVLGLGLVLAGRRLVEQQQPGPGGQCPPQLDQPGLTGRERVGPHVGHGLEPDALETGASAVAAGCSPVPAPPLADARPPPGCSRGRSARRTARGAGMCGPCPCGPACTGQPGDVLAVEHDPAPGRPLQAGDDVEQRGLARRRSGRSGRDAAAFGLQADVLDGDVATEAHRDLGDVKQRHGGLPPGGRAGRAPRP